MKNIIGKRKTCNKFFYKTEKEAKEAAKLTNYVSRKIGRLGGKLRTYKCKKCGLFHLTSKGRIEQYR